MAELNCCGVLYTIGMIGVRILSYSWLVLGTKPRQTRLRKLVKIFVYFFSRISHSLRDLLPRGNIAWGMEWFFDSKCYLGELVTRSIYSPSRLSGVLSWRILEEEQNKTNKFQMKPWTTCIIEGFAGRTNPPPGATAVLMFTVIPCPYPSSRIFHCRYLSVPVWTMHFSRTNMSSLHVCLTAPALKLRRDNGNMHYYY